MSRNAVTMIKMKL